MKGHAGLVGTAIETAEGAGDGGSSGGATATTAEDKVGQLGGSGGTVDGSVGAGQEVTPERAIVAVVGRVAKVGVPRERRRRGVAVGGGTAVAEGPRGRWRQGR